VALNGGQHCLDRIKGSTLVQRREIDSRLLGRQRAQSFTKDMTTALHQSCVSYCVAGLGAKGNITPS